MLFHEHYTHDSPSKSWFSIREPNQEESKEEIISPWDSEEANFTSIYFPVDVCSVELRPAWSSDQKNDSLSTYMKDLYFIILHHSDLPRFIHSHLPYSWDEAIKLAGLFRNQNLKSSLRIWKANKIGRMPIESR